jgi:hypothetical protein
MLGVRRHRLRVFRQLPARPFSRHLFTVLTAAKTTPHAEAVGFSLAIVAVVAAITNATSTPIAKTSTRTDEYTSNATTVAKATTASPDAWAADRLRPRRRSAGGALSRRGPDDGAAEGRPIDTQPAIPLSMTTNPD